MPLWPLQPFVDVKEICTKIKAGVAKVPPQERVSPDDDMADVKDWCSGLLGGGSQAYSKSSPPQCDSLGCAMISDRHVCKCTGMLPNTDVKVTVAVPAPVENGIQLDDKSCKCKLCLLYTSPSPRDATLSRMPSSA